MRLCVDTGWTTILDAQQSRSQSMPVRGLGSEMKPVAPEITRAHETCFAPVSASRHFA
jgi:hypothetical protein